MSALFRAITGLFNTFITILDSINKGVQQVDRGIGMIESSIDVAEANVNDWRNKELEAIDMLAIYGPKPGPKTE